MTVRLRTALLLVAVTLAVALPAAAAGERLPDGSTIAGVSVGGMGPRQAERAVRAALAPSYNRRIVVRAGSRRGRIDPRDAGLSIDYEGMVRSAFALAAAGQPVQVPLSLSIAWRKLRAAVAGLAPKLRREPVDARVRFGLKHARRVHGRAGKAVDRRALRRALRAELRQPTRARTVVAKLVTVRPKVTFRRLRSLYPSYISIDRAHFKLRLFRHLRFAHAFPIAVGMGGYDTPAGMRHVIYKQRNPPWHAPNRPWAGSYAGRTIPYGAPGNPLRYAFIALGDGVGIHGTAEDWSIGHRASHGCIRMHVWDIKRLYPRVNVGAPVLIR